MFTQRRMPPPILKMLATVTQQWRWWKNTLLGRLTPPLSLQKLNKIHHDQHKHLPQAINLLDPLWRSCSTWCHCWYWALHLLCSTMAKVASPTNRKKKLNLSFGHSFSRSIIIHNLYQRSIIRQCCFLSFLGYRLINHVFRYLSIMQDSCVLEVLWPLAQSC